MIITAIALSFALGAFAGAAIYLFAASAARGREADRLLHAERLRRAEHWHYIISDPEPWRLKPPSCGKDNW